MGYGRDLYTNDTVVIKLRPNYLGAYINVLDRVIEYDSAFNEYKNLLLTTGGIPPSLVAGFQNIHEELNFQNEVIRLIVAIHYISIISYTYLDDLAETKDASYIWQWKNKHNHIDTSIDTKK